MSYDRQFQREALARKDLNWPVTDPCLYNEAFTGRARAIPRCSFCLQDDHTGQYCPKNPNRPWLSWLPDWSSWLTVPAAASSSPHHPLPPPHQGPMAELCRRYNEGRCKQARCRFTHACSAPRTQSLPVPQCNSRPAHQGGLGRHHAHPPSQHRNGLTLATDQKSVGLFRTLIRDCRA